MGFTSLFSYRLKYQVIYATSPKLNRVLCQGLQKSFFQSYEYMANFNYIRCASWPRPHVFKKKLTQLNLQGFVLNSSLWVVLEFLILQSYSQSLYKDLIDHIPHKCLSPRVLLKISFQNFKILKLDISSSLKSDTATLLITPEMACVIVKKMNC
jgi:hypothetical protein